MTASPPPTNDMTPKERHALQLLQRRLHHKNLRLRAQATTHERIQALKAVEEVSRELENELKQASRIICEWMFKNKGAIYSVVYKACTYMPKLTTTAQYEDEEMFNILFLEGLRVMYNFDFQNKKKALPLSYLINTLSLRKNDLLYKLPIVSAANEEALNGLTEQN